MTSLCVWVFCVTLQVCGCYHEHLCVCVCVGGDECVRVDVAGQCGVKEKPGSKRKNPAELLNHSQLA